MNLGIFGGRLGKDAEKNQLSSGDAVANFSLAVEVGTKQAPKTMWVECAVFGKRAESLMPYLLKGTKVTVSGRISLDEYTSRSGEKKSAMRLTINEIDLHLPPRDQASAPAQAPRQAAAPSGSGMDDMDNDLPF